MSTATVATMTKLLDEPFAKELKERLVHTVQLSRALEDTNPDNPDAREAITKKAYTELKRIFSKFRDETAGLVADFYENYVAFGENLVTETDFDQLGSTEKVSSFAPNTVEWTNARRAGLGGSDVGYVATALLDPGLSEARAASNLIRVIQSKTFVKEMSNNKNDTHLATSGALYRGNCWEDFIRLLFAERHPEYRVFNTKSQHVNTDCRWQKVNIDGCYSSTGSEVPDSILEIKTGGDYAIWQNGVPNNYRAQVLYYLHATGFKQATVVVVLNDVDYREYTLVAEDEIVPGTGVSMPEFLEGVGGEWIRENLDF